MPKLEICAFNGGNLDRLVAVLLGCHQLGPIWKKHARVKTGSARGCCWMETMMEPPPSLRSQCCKSMVFGFPNFQIFPAHLDQGDPDRQSAEPHAFFRFPRRCGCGHALRLTADVIQGMDGTDVGNWTILTADVVCLACGISSMYILLYIIHQIASRIHSLNFSPFSDIAELIRV